MSKTDVEDRNARATQQAARFCADLTYDDLSEDVLSSTKKSFIDTIGASFAGTTSRAGTHMLRYVGTLGGEEATVIGAKGESLAHLAALANGTTAHALEIDDGHRGASAHPGSAIIPAALATAEKHDRSGKELVTAIVAGYDVMVKTAMSVQTSHRERHFHATATCGCFGSAAAVSKILNLDETQTAHALGLAGTQAGGLFEFLAKGSMSKRFHPGRAGMAGVLASELAREGFDGPDTIIEGEEGFAEAYAATYDLSPFDTLGDPYSITESYLKPYPCCRHIHGPIQAIQKIRASGVESATVDTIRVETYRSAAYHDKTRIENTLDAQMSIPYCVAIALATGEATLSSFDPSHTQDETVATLLEATEVVATDEMERKYPETRPARVIVTTTDGRRFEETILYPLGAPEAPLSEERIADKFRDVTDPVLDSEDKERIIDGAFSIEEYSSVSSFTDLL